MARSPDEVREAKRLHMARKRAADPEAARAYSRQFHHRNREANVAKMREYYGRRFFWGRAMKLRGTNRANYVDLARQWKLQRGRCALTGRKLTRDNANLEHRVPKARGGTDEATNLRWVCEDANFCKRDLTDEEFLFLCSEVVEWLGGIVIPDPTERPSRAIRLRALEESSNFLTPPLDDDDFEVLLG